MSTPRIYYYPDPDGSLETIDLLEGLSSIICTPVVAADEARSGMGLVSEALHHVTYRVRVVLDRFQTSGVGKSALERQLLTLQRHLLRGGYIGLSRDHAKTWAALSTVSEPTRGSATFTTGGNGFGAWSSAGAVASGDEIEIEGCGPFWYGETTTVSAVSGGVVTLAEALRYTYTFYNSNTYPLVRWRDFWPVLRLPVGERTKAIVTDDHRLNWTLDMALEYSTPKVVSLWNGQSEAYPGAQSKTSRLNLRDGTASRASAPMTLEGMLGVWAASRPNPRTSPRVVR